MLLNTMSRRKVLFGIAIAAPLLLIAEERPDLLMINRIKAEAFENSKVMDHAFYLTDVYGPRVANSPGYRAAADWAVKKLAEYGLVNTHLEKWDFGRGWSFSKFYVAMTEPSYAPLIGFPLAWSAGTDGLISGEPVLAPLRTDADLDKWRGKLKGKLVMTDPPRELPMQLAANGHRYTDAELEKEASAPEPGASPFRTGDPAAVPPGTQPGVQAPPSIIPGTQPVNLGELRRFRTKLQKFLTSEGVAAAIQIGRGDGGTVFGQSSGTKEPKEPLSVPSIVLDAEHYNRIARLLARNIPVKLELEVKSSVQDSDLNSANVIGEIPGGRKKDEVVMIGAHLDSWQGGTGATDNAAGCAVAMEVMRILKTLNIKMDRTVRIALWGGEEAGLLGSKAYVKAHFADPAVMKVLPEHAKLDAYFNLDNGTGKIRGIYLQGLDMERPIFDAWMAPFRDLGATTVSIRNTGGTDHLSFAAVGLPGFQFIQDQMEYSTRTHHSNMDVYDRLQKGDLMQAAAIMASFVYHTAMRDEMLPRKPLPKPTPERRPDGTIDEKKPDDMKPAPTEGGARGAVPAVAGR